MEPTEQELCRKLLLTFHLSVPERRSLPGGKARFSILVAIVKEMLDETGWFPRPIVRGEDIGEAAVIEACGLGFLVHTQHEVSMARFGPIVSRRYWTLRGAVRAYLRLYGRGEIDGVPIRWIG